MTAETPPSRHAAWRFVALGIVLVALVTGIAVLFSSLPGSDPAGGPAAERGRDAAADTSPTGTAAPATATSSPSSDATLAPAVPSDPNSSPPRTSSEVENPTSGTGARPAPPTRSPLLTGALPASASEVGTLVAGFPSAIPVAAGSSVVSSSVAPSSDAGGERLQATLVADTAASASDVVEYYQGVFVALGLVATELPANAGSTALSFQRDGDSITLTATPAATGSHYSLFGVIVAG